MAKTTYIVFRATNEEFDRIISHLGRFIYNFPNYYPKTGLRFRDFCRRCNVQSPLSIEEHKGSRLFLYESQDERLTMSTMGVLIDHGVLTITAPDFCMMCEYCAATKDKGTTVVEDRKVDMEHMMLDVKPAHIVAKLNKNQKEEETTKVKEDLREGSNQQFMTPSSSSINDSISEARSPSVVEVPIVPTVTEKVVKEEPKEERTLSEEQVEAPSTNSLNSHPPSLPSSVAENGNDENRPIDEIPAPKKRRIRRSIVGIEGDNIVPTKRHRQQTAKMLASLEEQKK